MSTHRSRWYEPRRRAWHIAGAVGAAVALTSTPATASDFSLSIPLDRTASGAPGAMVLLVDQPVPATLVGRSCEATYRSENNGSVHPGTDLVIASGGVHVDLSDVESVAGKTTSGSAAIVLGSSVSVSVRLGGDGFASLGADLAFTCTAVTAPTTTPTIAPATTAVTVTTTPASVAPTSMPPQPTASSTTSTTSTTGTAPAATGGPTTIGVGAGGPVPSVSAAGVTTTPAAAAGPTSAGPAGTLPATGSDTWVLFAIGAIALVAGAAARQARTARD